MSWLVDRRIKIQLKIYGKNFEKVPSTTDQLAAVRWNLNHFDK